MHPRIHTFYTSGEAYDGSQCRDDIHDGDVLHVPSEHVVGVLVQAWPVAVSPEAGVFHVLEDGYDLTTLDDGKYADSAALAATLLNTEER